MIAEVCAWCGFPDGYRNRQLVLEPRIYTHPMHRECMEEIARWGCD